MIAVIANQHKKGFKLTVVIRQEHIRLNLWLEIFNTFKVPVDEYEIEDAHVKVCFAYQGDPYPDNPDVEFDLKHAIQRSKTYDWKAAAIAYFNTVHLPFSLSTPSSLPSPLLTSRQH
jgi:hypothetical protein